MDLHTLQQPSAPEHEALQYPNVIQKVAMICGLHCKIAFVKAISACYSGMA